MNKKLTVDTKNPVFFVGWDLVARHGVGYRVKDVMDKLKEFGLPEEAAEIRSRSAITRALREAAVGGKDLRILMDDDKQILFQLTNISVEDDDKYGKIAKYLDEVHIRFDKKTDDESKLITCANKKIKDFVVEKFLICKEHYRTNDITRILLRIFNKHSDIVQIRRKGGAYIVPATHVELVENIRKFVRSLSKRNRTTIFRVAAAEAGEDIAPLIVESKLAEAKAFRKELRELVNSSEPLSTRGKNSLNKRLSEMKRKLTIWTQTIAFESEEIDKTMRRCDKLLLQQLGAEVAKKKKKSKKKAKKD